jgi:hypothetical protein
MLYFAGYGKINTRFLIVLTIVTGGLGVFGLEHASVEMKEESRAEFSAALAHPSYVGPPIGERAATSRAITMVSSLAVSPGGRLWVTWYAGPTPGEDRNNYVALATSGDDGETWEEVLVVDPDEFGEQLRTFDPEIWIDPQGRLWLLWAQAVSHGVHAHTWGMVADDPESAHPEWSEPRIIAPGVMMCKPIVLSDGTWAFPISDWEGRRLKTPDAATSQFWVSEDEGETFTLRGAALVPVEARSYDEQMFVERKDGSIWMLVRTRYGIGESVSTDGGVTWPEVTPSNIPHPSARFFITRLQSDNLLLVKHGPIDERSGRSHLMAFISKDDGRAWEGGLLLDERNGISYPDGQQAEDGTVYITYDYDRRGARQILFATFKEEDALVGEAVTDAVRLRQLVSQGSGGQERQASKSAEPRSNEDGESLRTHQTGALAAKGVSAEALKSGAHLFVDRKRSGYFAQTIPAALKGAHYLRLPMEGNHAVSVTKAGTVFLLTPQPDRNRDSQSQPLIDQGFRLVALPEFSLIAAGGAGSIVSVYQKDVEKGETITIGKWAVPLFWGEPEPMEHVEPAIKIIDGLFDETDTTHLGLQQLPIERTVVYEATEDNWKFSHTSNLVVFNNNLHLMWSNGMVDEDSAGQRILYSTSSDGINWSEPHPIMTPDTMSDNEKGALMSSGWHVHKGVLVGYATWSESSRFMDFEQTMLRAVTTTDGNSWSKPQEVVPGTFLEGPRQLNDNTLILLGQGASHQPLFYYSSNPDGLNDGKEAVIDAHVPAGWPEPSGFIRPDGSVVAVLRTTRDLARLWATESFDGGRTWINTWETNFPDAWARTSAGNLPCGTSFIVSNPIRAVNRDIMTIALSEDGNLFDRAFVLLQGAPALKFSGKYKRPGFQYPNARVWGDHLYVAYTVGKEDVEVVRVKLDALMK